MGVASLVAVLVSVFQTVCLTFKRLLLSRNPIPRYPPAMPSIPIIGSLPFISDPSNIHKTFVEEAKHLGRIFSCYVGSKYTVVLNDSESIREAFLRKGSAFSDRSGMFVMKHFLHPKWQGIVHRSYDAEFIRYHHCILSIIKDFGMGHARMEERIQCEIEELVQLVREIDGKSFDPLETINHCILNVICTILFGKRISQTDPVMTRLLQLVQKTTVNYPAVVDLFPLLRFVPCYRKRIQTASTCMKEQKLLIAEKIRLCLTNETKETSLIVSFVEQEGTDCDRDNLTELVRQLIFAGSDTTTFTVLWALFLLANHQDLQERVHDELDRSVPSDRLPCYGDVTQLPLTEATVLEVMRFKTMVPLAIPHKTKCDSEVGGFFIPKDTVILPNIYAVHMDKDEWGDPDVFRPERFLDESDGKVVGRNRLMPFSIGKRSCIGEGIARVEVFLVASSLMQQFHVYPGTGENKVECRERTYIVTRPSAFKIRLVPRKK